MDKLVYVCCKTNSIRTTNNLLLYLKEKHPECCFISPLLMFSYLNQSDRDFVLEHYLFLLDMCDEMWTFGSESKSIECEIERKFAEKHKIPVVEVRT